MPRSNIFNLNFGFCMNNHLNVQSFGSGSLRPGQNVRKGMFKVFFIKLFLGLLGTGRDCL